MGENRTEERTVPFMEFLQETFGELLSTATVTSVLRGAVRIVVIIFLAQVGLAIIRRVVERIFTPKRSGVNWRHWDEKRARTVASLVNSVANYTIYFIAGVMVLDTMGLNTSSLLAAAGIAGLAVGFGAQNLVKDVVSGFFILVENQFQDRKSVV